MYTCIYVFTFKLWFLGQNSKTSKYQMLAMHICTYVACAQISVNAYDELTNITL